MNHISLSIIMVLVLIFCSSVQGQSKVEKFEKLSDEQLYRQFSSTCYDNSDIAAQLFLKRGEKVLAFLLSKKGDKNLFFGSFYRTSETNPADLTWEPTNNLEYNKRLLKNGDLRSMEVATLFLINAIFHESFFFSQTPNLKYETSEGFPKVGNKPQLIKKAWKAVDKWAIQLKAEGLAELQRKKISPLDLERDGVDFY